MRKRIGKRKEEGGEPRGGEGKRGGEGARPKDTLVAHPGVDEVSLLSSPSRVPFSHTEVILVTCDVRRRRGRGRREGRRGGDGEGTVWEDGGQGE